MASTGQGSHPFTRLLRHFAARNDNVRVAFWFVRVLEHDIFTEYAGTFVLD